ncbi:phospholipid scramblase 1-like isoform X5 [Elgaria multicarinata webbii]|uniref:phospholipid scramblase 1-like isoform X5 n=1 Tax=Elgaria multicarinata webbii TaxID=159646 RepID=UPI002FCCC204
MCWSEIENDSAPVPTPPAYPGPGYPGPGYPGVQPQYGFPQQAPRVAYPGQPFLSHPSAYGAVPLQTMPVETPPVVWMPPPPAIPKCPPGLEYLSQVDHITVQQQMELLEMISGYETLNRYEVKNSLGQWLYFAAEENDDFNLNMYGAFRSFNIKLFDSSNQPVIQLTRAFHCSCCCCPCICCLQELEVQAPPGTPIGYIKQRWHPCLPKFDIQNESGQTVLKIDAPCVGCRMYQDVHFEVKSLDQKATIGTITKLWGGLAREAATNASNFELRFPLDLDIKMKALVLGAVFLMDFMFFEQRHQRPQDRQS